jgi:hypothetical protein
MFTRLIQICTFEAPLLHTVSPDGKQEQVTSALKQLLTQALFCNGPASTAEELKKSIPKFMQSHTVFYGCLDELATQQESVNKRTYKLKAADRFDPFLLFSEGQQVKANAEY